jgi:predicted RNase H-like nuclease (RuvC/YqgF family)
LTSEEYLKKLSDSRDQAVAQVRSLEEKLKQKEAVINAMKSANPTLDALSSEVYESTYKEENEYLKQIIKQMRDEIETLANQLPQKDKSFRSPLETNDKMSKTNDSGLILMSTKSDGRPFDNTIINDHVESLNQKVTVLRKEKMELTSYLKKQQIRVMHLEKNVASTSEQLQGKQTQIETLQYELNSQTRRNTAEVNSLKQRIAELELELNESHKEADEYHKNFIQKESEIAGLELKVRMLLLLGIRCNNCHFV